MRARLRRVAWCAALAAMLCGTVAPEALAAAAGGRIAVGPFNGRRAARIRAQVVRWLRAEGYEIVGWGKVVRARGAGASVEGFRQAASELGVAAFIAGRVRRRGSRWQATITIRGADGAPRVAGSWQSPSSRGLVYAVTTGGRAQLLQEVGATAGGAPAPRAARAARAAKPPTRPAALRPPRTPGATPTERAAAAPAAAAAPSTPAPAAAEEPLFQQGERRAAVEVEDPRPGRRRARRRVRRLRLPALDVGFGVQVLSRAFRYHDDLYGGLREHTLAATPALAGTLDWYPAAHFTSGLLAHLGVGASVQHALGLSPIASNGVDFPISAGGWSVAALGRYRFWRVHLDARVGYGAQSFTIDAVPEATREHELPGVAFRFVRLGTRGRARIWRGLSAAVGLAYLAVLEAGELASERFFPRASAGGFDLELELAYEVLFGIEVRAGFALRRFGIALNPEPGDVHVVGGASDQYTVVSAGLGYRLRRGRRR